jgi:hypothetical protein
MSAIIPAHVSRALAVLPSVPDLVQYGKVASTTSLRAIYHALLPISRQLHAEKARLSLLVQDYKQISTYDKQKMDDSIANTNRYAEEHGMDSPEFTTLYQQGDRASDAYIASSRVLYDAEKDLALIDSNVDVIKLLTVINLARSRLEGAPRMPETTIALTRICVDIDEAADMLTPPALARPSPPSFPACPPPGTAVAVAPIPPLAALPPPALPPPLPPPAAAAAVAAPLPEEDRTFDLFDQFNSLRRLFGRGGKVYEDNGTMRLVYPRTQTTLRAIPYHRAEYEFDVGLLSMFKLLGTDLENIVEAQWGHLTDKVLHISSRSNSIRTTIRSGKDREVAGGMSPTYPRVRPTAQGPQRARHASVGVPHAAQSRGVCLPRNVLMLIVI